MATTTNSEEKSVAPSVIWAQRSDVLFLTIELDDIRDEDVKLDNNSLFFHAKGGHENKTYEVRLDFFKEVDPKRSKELKTARHMVFNIYKKEQGAYWPRLLSKSGKNHFLKIDFGKWHDEDDSEDETGTMDDRSLEDMMKQMSSGTSNLPDMDDMQAPDSDDSDDEDLPDLEDTGDTKE